MAAYLASINSKWKDGNDVALLNESNTRTVDARTTAMATDTDAAATLPENSKRDSEDNASAGQAFANAKVFNFPLHIAQLRS